MEDIAVIRSRLLRTRTFAVALALTSLSAFGGTHQPEFKAPANPPSLANATTLDGQPFDIASQHGKWVVVFAWSSWCVPCIDGLSVVADYIKAHHDVTAIGLDASEQDHAQLARFLSRHTFNFPLVTLPAAEAARFQTQVIAIPDTWVIAPNGTTAQSRMGGLKPEQLVQLMRKAGYPQPQ